MRSYLFSCPVDTPHVFSHSVFDLFSEHEGRKLSFETFAQISLPGDGFVSVTFTCTVEKNLYPLEYTPVIFSLREVTNFNEAN